MVELTGWELFLFLMGGLVDELGVVGAGVMVTYLYSVLTFVTGLLPFFTTFVLPSL